MPRASSSTGSTQVAGSTPKRSRIVTAGILGANSFRDIAAVLDAAAGGPPDFAAFTEVMRRQGLTLVR